MNCMNLRCKIASDFRIEYEYNVTGAWAEYFTSKKFFVEYSVPLSNVNSSVAILPALGTFLPLAWIFDAEIQVDEIDEMFYNAIPAFKKGYIDMYPQLEFKGKLTVGNFVKNDNLGTKTAALFSGGVDAFNTLLSHIDEKPDLITVWGADIAIDNESGWRVVESHRDSVLESWGLEGITIKSSFKTVIEEAKLSDYTLERVKDGWWHGFHHGLGMFALSAPIAYVKHYAKIYIASSFTAADKGKYTCASDPTIDNFVQFCGCSIVHDGYEFHRQDKIRRICAYAKKTQMKIPLRVCWESTGGSNCCKCEKCYRTMLGIYAERENPVNYGFGCDGDEISQLLKKEYRRQFGMNFRYQKIQARMRENYKKGEVASSVKWFYNTDVVTLERKFKQKQKMRRVLGKIKCIPGRFVRMFGIRK